MADDRRIARCYGNGSIPVLTTLDLQPDSHGTWNNNDGTKCADDADEALIHVECSSDQS